VAFIPGYTRTCSVSVSSCQEAATASVMENLLVDISSAAADQQSNQQVGYV